MGSKLSRTHRKVMSPGFIGKQTQSNSKRNQEKTVCLDQMDLDLLQDCVAENAVVIAPKSLKLSRPKVKSRKVSPAQKPSAKQLPGFTDDMDCSILEELLEELPGNYPESNKAKETSILKPSKVVLNCPNQVQSSLSLHKAHTDKLSAVKIGSQKRSPSRGNSPYAKRVQTEPNLAKSGTHVKSLFQGNHSALDLDEIRSEKKTEKLISIDEVDIGEIGDTEDECPIEASQPFTDVKKPENQCNQPTDNKEEDTVLDSVSALLQKTPNRLKPSPCKPQESRGIVSPGTEGLWDALNDSFLLAAAEMEALDEMEAEANCKTEGKSVDSQLSHELKMMSPFKSQGSTQPQVQLPADLKRYAVTSVIQEDWQKTVHVVDLCDHSSKSCILQGTWFETPLHEGSIVAIHGAFDEQGICKITPQQNFIIVNPDLLLTGTNVTKSIRCLRRSVLGEKFKGLDKASKPMLLGTTLHEVFDEALAKKCFTVDFLRRVVQKTLKKPAFLVDMYSLGLTEKQLMGDAEEYMTTMKHWADRYLQNQPKAMATMDIKFPGQMKSEKCNVCVSGIKDIEETVWSPRWGLKGKVDITAQVKIQRTQMRSSPKTYTVPLELKTGRQTNSIEHRSQVMLYSVMLGDLDDQAANDLGVLLYVKTGAMLAVPAMQMDKRELLHLRNQLAYSLSIPATKAVDDKWTAPSLPEPIRDEFTCGMCSCLTSCAMLCSTDPSSSSDEMPKLFTEQLAHLSPPHKEYFTHWYLMCVLEHMAVEKRNTTKQIWCKDPWEREKQGDCMSGLVLSTCRRHQQRDCYLVTFKRKTDHKSVLPMSSLPFSVGDRVVVGLEESRIVTCCIGFIETLTDGQVTMTSERALKTQVGGTYRLDKDDGYNSMASSLVNLAKLMEQEHTRIRNLVVDLEKPVFDPSPTLQGAKRHHVNTILKSLNSDQQEAINRVLCSQQYTLIVGMPGTGKTTTIVGLVRILHACGLSVLLTSYTHSAVDNILLKLCKFGIDFLRLGSKHRVHPDLHKYTEDVMLSQVGSVQQLGSTLETKPVVATTCLGSKHKLLTRRVFDVCIVDEASQIGQLVCLGPLYVANRFVLVGDHQQLPPLVQSTAARKLGMDESLFQRLALHRPESSIQLSLQYRMNSAIMDISNALVYDGKLQCGNESIAKGTLDIPHWDRLQQNFPEKWFLQVLNPSNTVTFLNTDKVEKHSNDDAAGKSTVNHTEAELVMILVKTLIQGGCKPCSIGVIAPYRLQCKLLSGIMNKEPLANNEVEINTVDKYQGRDKEVIIVSFTHRDMGHDSHAGVLLEDMRRLNVAVTRAKHKLILLGSVMALNKLQTMQQLLHCLANNDQISF
ncbi:DNA replication ATP-dependent helicase/nuclease DNA2-like [Amphiura filiformis]|uniref:DNA replication ATP-dependent helicase/nuclease DNA2-like n=1 Tax=Amphiura filiformis TaxID=82378 RepID=UPI003B22118F